MSKENSTDANDDNVKMLERVLGELSERIRLTEKQLMATQEQLTKTHQIAVRAWRAGKQPLESKNETDSAPESPGEAGPSIRDSDDLESGDELPTTAADTADEDDSEVLDDIQTFTDDPTHEPPQPPAMHDARKVDSPPQAFAAPVQEPHPIPPAAPYPPQATTFSQPVSQPVSASADGGEWESMLLGDQLATVNGIDADRRALLAGLRCGEPAAGVLLGTLLVFRNSTPDRMAQLLKDIGEAYYRWRPETAGAHDLFRQAMIEMLHSLCESASVLNRIELVQPGDRFDSARHHTKQRGGMEVLEVQGWVVVRENGKPYTKANVTVQ